MYSAKQMSKINRFFEAIEAAKLAGRRGVEERRFLIDWFLTKADLLKLDETRANLLEANDHNDPERRMKIFSALEWWHRRRQFAKTANIATVLCWAIFATYYIVFKSIIIGGLFFLLCVPLFLVGYPLLLVAFAGARFSPLSMGLTIDECQFAIDYIVGDAHWKD